MSNDEPWGRPPGAATNQFGTPVNQFGTSAGQLGVPRQSGAPTGAVGSRPSGAEPGGSMSGSMAGSLGGPVNQFGHPASFAAPVAQPWSAAPARRSSARWVVGAAALTLVVLAGVLVRTYVFPDLSKPIELPSTVAGVSTAGSATGQPVTMQSKDEKGRATAVGFYADDPAAPLTMVVVTAGRVKNLGTEQITEPTRTIGKVTCTDNVATASLLAQAGAGPDAAALRRMTTGAACWRTGRHLTVLAVAFTAHEAAQTTARQAVMDSWDAI